MMLRPFTWLCRCTPARRTLQNTRIHHAAFQSSSFSAFAARPPLSVSSRFERETAVARFMSTEAREEEEEYPRFEDKLNLHPSSKKALEKMGLKTMTEIQAKTFDAAASGQDVMARARTGTGKTMAFLLPALNRIAENPIKGQVNMLILSPTRELASQIANQARQLTSAHSGMSYQVMFGGSSRQKDIQQLENRVPTIIVATPGRLQDHFDNTHVRDKRFSALFHKTQVLVLDEMDRLLDMGFRKSVEQIMTYLPLQKQTLLFSATLPTGVKQLIKGHMSSDYVTVDCIHDADPASHTNDLVEQSHVVVSQDKVVMATIGILLRILEDPDTKVIVFFPTTKMVKYYAELFNGGLERTVIELHSGKSQSYRTSASNRFREVKKGVLFTSDVSARGVDYDNVSHVVQVGMADSRETYIHRLGRTARAGKKGQGILVLSEIEKGFLRMLQGLDIKVDEEMHELAVNPPSERVLQQLDPVMESIRTKRNLSLVKSAQGSYRGMMGYYKGNLSRIGIKSPEKCVQFVNSYALQSGLDQVPTFTERTARNMGMFGVAGIKCGPDERGGSGGGGGGNGYRGGGGGGRGKANSPRNNRSNKNRR